ncbi:MAG: hypothetical protein QHH26_01555 [Armatimonadota bacterium]|nr:hypothetical protein [Armatimonadota bacterium]
MEKKMRICGMIFLLTAAAILANTNISEGGKVKIDKIAYFNQPNCYRLSNGTVEVIATSDIGPRVIAYRFIGGENILAELGKGAVVKTDLGDWHPWGGHRLWHAPESIPRSYVPDNAPIKVEEVGSNAIRLIQPVEAPTGIRKEILLKLADEGTKVTLIHKLTNEGIWPVELAPWALTIVAGGGTTIIPQEPFIPHEKELLPARPMVLWHYTDLSDSRWKFLKKYICLRTDENLRYPQKIGVLNKQGWAAYLRKDLLFVKKFPFVEGAAYPDMGCNCETYTDGAFMEVETLGPMVKLNPGASTEHIEEWFLFDGIKAEFTDASLDEVLKPIVEKCK